MYPADHTSNGLKALAGLLAGKKRFILLTHVNPDGDALGSLIALGQGLAALGKKATMYCEDGVPSLYEFLPGSQEVTAVPGGPEDYEAAVLLDCNSLKRAGEQALSMADVPVLAVLDHHIPDGPLPESAVVDEKISATGELVYHLLLALKAEITPEIATNLFVAISTDTGSFSYENTTAEVMALCGDLVRKGARPWKIFQDLHLNRPPQRLRLLGLSLKDVEFFLEGRIGALTVTNEMMSRTVTTAIDTDGFVEYPRFVRGVELALLFRETDNGGCKVSLRSKGRFNAAALARSFGGGGHVSAAGFTAQGPLEEIKRAVIETAGGLMPGSENSQ